MLSKKYYKEIAELLNKYTKAKDYDITTIPIKLLVNDFIRLFTNDNPRFDKGKFMSAILKDNKLEEPPKEDTIQIPYYTKD